MAEILEALRNYYHEQRICVEHFDCPHRAECSAEAEEFTEAREASVGERYLSGDYPRLLVVSLDPGSGDEERKLKVWRGPADLSNHHPSHHWQQTHELARQLMKVFGVDVSREGVAPYFAHISAVRCSENRDRNRQARFTLYKNCQPYLRPELVRLHPDIIVTQGDRAEWAVKESFEGDEFEVNTCEGVKYRSLTLHGQSDVIWFHTYHPGAYGLYRDQQREEWPTFRTILQDTFSTAG